MQRGTKAKSIENFKIRRCVVRLQKMKTQLIKVTRSTATKGPTPLKKRPLTSSVISSPTNSMKAKERLKTPVMQRNTKVVQSRKSSTPVVEELPPTIAAGRSRRAHKPNPKYASEDMVTPRNLKSGRKDADSEGKQRRTSGSSLEDFFNKDTSEEELLEDLDDTEDDKKYKISKRIVSDSDFADGVEDSDASTQKRRPGRPRKYPLPVELGVKRSTNTSSTPTVLNKSGPTIKSLSTQKGTPATKTAPTQLQQLRRTLGATTASPLSLGRKRKLDEGGSTPLPVTAKRFLLSTDSSKTVIGSTVVTRRSSPSQILNGTKASTTGVQIQKREGSNVSVQEKKSPPIKISSSFLTSKSLPGTKLQQSQQKSISTIPPGTTISKVSSVKAGQSNKQSSTSPLSTSRSTAPKPKAGETSKARTSKLMNETPKEDSVIDDFETMPTFTIVNINDIINKKGDVLISKTPLHKRTSGERRSTNVGQQRSNILANKASPDRLKNSQFRTSTPLTRKPVEKNLNTSPSSSSLTAGGSGCDKKPPPRILNSVVGRKTKPIKPMITNLDISADSPSCSLSLYDDDEELDNDMKIGDSSGNETEPKSKLYGASATIKSKSSDPKTAAKENSLAATNVLPKSQMTQSKPLDTRKLSPEKVIVSRQGDKIIKKITCFETWYVINVPADAPEEHERNNLDMPLIELANSTKNIKLPSELWTTKVTLYELSASTIAKSNLVLYTGELSDQNISEEERCKYQPSCVMFRRVVSDRVKSTLPYDRAVIFKNKTFFTNIEGKNVKLVGAPSTISQISEIETLLHIVDSLSLRSSLVEPAATVS